MSDWASIRYSKKPEIPKKEGVNFVYEDDEEDDFDDDVQMEEVKEEVKVIEKEIPVSTISEEQIKTIERKAAYKVSLKKSITFGLGGGCMLGGMLGAYDTFQKPAGTKYTMTSLIKKMSFSMPVSLLCMGGFFGIYQVTKVSMQHFRQSRDFYNNVTGCAVGLLPFMKVPFMRKYILYPFVLLFLDMYGDWKEMHPKCTVFYKHVYNAIIKLIKDKIALLYSSTVSSSPSNFRVDSPAIIN